MEELDRTKRTASDMLPLVDRSKRARQTYGGDMNQGPGVKLQHDSYTVGWVCALPLEMAAAEAVLDDFHDPLLNERHDTNAYKFGHIGPHNIVIACLPSNHYGTNNAAVVANNMRRSFPSITKWLVVGVGGGAPDKVDVRLGDVIVGDVVTQYDFGKLENGRLQRTNIPTRPPVELMTAVSSLRSTHYQSASQVSAILKDLQERYPTSTSFSPPQAEDKLFEHNYEHPASTILSDSCEKCDPLKVIGRSPRSGSLQIHYGRIGSGNQVVKHGNTRREIAEEVGVICFEMEGAGLMNHFPALVIRGICDYSDSHKNKEWQPYAAAVAAAYTKELLGTITQSAFSSSSARNRQRVTNTGSQNDRLLTSLEFDEVESRHATIGTALNKTCKWILEDKDYLEWLTTESFTDHHGLLWISGKPGAGKSTMIKFIFTQTRKTAVKSTEAVIAFFFNARGAEMEKSTLGMYQSLLLQIFHEFPDLDDILNDYRHFAEKSQGKGGWTIQALESLFRSVIQNLGHRRLTCFIDALDECDEEQIRQMVHFFEELGDVSADASTQLYVCFSSRHYPHIRIDAGLRLTLEDQDGHAQDLEKYVSKHLNTGKSVKVSQEIIPLILAKAQGIFLWIVLAVRILNKESSRGRILTLKQRLSNLPSGLTELLRDILTRDREDLSSPLLCIQWILFAQRPLKCEEFYYALHSGFHLEPDTLKEWDPEEVTLEDMKLFVLDSSKGLAELTKGKKSTVQFIHESVRDFLLKENGIRELWPNHSDNFEASSHNTLRDCCNFYNTVDLTNILPSGVPEPSSKEGKSLKETVSSRFPFLSYSVNQILYHGNQAGGTLQQDEFLSKLESESWRAWLRLRNLFQNYGVRCYTLEASLVYVLAENNWVALLQSAFRLHPEQNLAEFKTERHENPLFAAAANGSAEAVGWLLDNGHAHINLQDIIGRTALHLSAHHNKDGVVKLLLTNSNIDVNLTDYAGASSLEFSLRHEKSIVCDQLLATEDIRLDLHAESKVWDHACRNGHTTTVEMLLTLWETRASHLSLAERLRRVVESDYISIAEVLLRTGLFDLSPTEWTRESVLVWAARNASISPGMLKFLLDLEDVDVNYQDNEGRNALSWYAQVGGKEHCFQLLVQNTAQIDERDNTGRSPFSYAVTNRSLNIAMTKILLAAGPVDINSRDKEGRTAFSWAATSMWVGSPELTDFFSIFTAIEVDSKDNVGRTPLSWAARYDNTSFARLLLNIGTADPDSRDNDGRTPLSWTASCSETVFAQLLLDTGAVNPDSRDNEGRTPLLWAAIYKNTNFARLLLNIGTADPDSRDNDGRTPLSWTASYGETFFAQLLLITGAVNPDSRDNHGRSPLSWAVCVSRTGFLTVRQLLATGAVDVDQRDNDGRTPLSWAASFASYECTDITVLLLDTGAVDINSKDKTGRTPLSWVGDDDSFSQIREILRARGALE